MNKIAILTSTTLLTIGSFSGYLFINSKISVGEKLLADGQKQYDAGQKRLAEGKAQLAAGEHKLRTAKKARWGAASFIPIVGASTAVVAVGGAAFHGVDKKLSEGDQKVAEGKKQVRDGEAKLAAGKLALANGDMELQRAQRIRFILGVTTWLLGLLTVGLGLFWRKRK